MAECKKGCLVRSLAGHDKGDYYIIMESQEEWVYLANGSTRKIDAPKKKNKKHIQIICRFLPEEETTDETVRLFLRNYQRQIRIKEAGESCQNQM